MAFISISTVRPSTLHHPHSLSNKRTCCLPCSKPRWVCLARSHPFGNGGIPTELDFSNFDPAKTRAKFAAADAEYEASPDRSTDHISNWALLICPDIIQWNNNIFKASVEAGFNWDLRDVKLVRIAERTARRDIEQQISELYVVQLGDEGVDEFLVVNACGKGSDDADKFLLTFEEHEDVTRLVDLIISDGHHARAVRMSTATLKQHAEAQNLLLALAPSHSLISPAQIGMTL